MSRANILEPFLILTNGDLGGDLVSEVTTISYQDNIAIQCNVTATAVGTFAVQGSSDYVPPPQGVQNTPANTGNWVTIGSLTVAGADILLFDVNQCAFPNIRLIFTDGSAGANNGVVNAYVSGKKL